MKIEILDSFIDKVFLWKWGLNMNNEVVGKKLKDVRAEIFTPEEIIESTMRVPIISAIIEARHEQGISQKQLEELSGVKQPVIARMETGKTNLQLDTILKILASLDKTLTGCSAKS